MPDTFETELSEAIPALRRFALSLTHNGAEADDLVQDCLERALSHRHQFTPNTRLHAWLFTILRNRFISLCRSRRAVTVPVDAVEGELTVAANQEEALAAEDVHRTFECLPEQDRRVLTLVGSDQLSYAATAEALGVEVGTVKSRVFRARARFARLHRRANSTRAAAHRIVGRRAEGRRASE